MKNLWYGLLILLTACAAAPSDEPEIWEIPNINRVAAHTRVIKTTPTMVVYEYKDVRVDEIAPVAALYCYDHGKKQAELQQITMRPDFARRAVFACVKLPH